MGYFFWDKNCKKDEVVALEVLEGGGIVVGGFALRPATSNSSFPLTATLSQHSQFTGGAYIAEFSSDNELLWATRLTSDAGSFPENSVVDIAEDPSTHDLLVLGRVDADAPSGDFIPYGAPTYPTFSYQGGREAFIMRFDQNRALVWSTYFGGSDKEEPNSIAALKNGDFVITGGTISTQAEGFPVMMYGGNTRLFM